MGATTEVYFASNRGRFADDPPRFGEKFHRDGAQRYRAGKATVRAVAGEYTLESVEVVPESAHRSDEDADSTLGSSAVSAEIKERMGDDGCDLLVLLHGCGADCAMRCWRSWRCGAPTRCRRSSTTSC